MRRAVPLALAASLCAALAAPLPGALARAPHARGAEAPAPPATTTTPAPPTPPAEPAKGILELLVQHVGGTPTFALTGRRILVRGFLAPYVAGEHVKVSVYRDGRKVAVRTFGLSARTDGSGEFHFTFRSAQAGLVQARAVHYASAALAQLTARSRGVRFVHASVSPGSSGASVRLLQSELSALHYSVPLDGVFDEGTSRALVAFRKVSGLERIPYAGRDVFERLQRGGGHFRVRYRRDGRHVEADLTRQVLAEIEAGGRIHKIYPMSSGKPSTPTVVGHFNVYSKMLGVNQKGMVDSNYFIRGYAIHGYAEVPVYAASHGCLRVPIPNAASIYSWVRIGTPVDVYNEGGGGSRHARAHAGP
jgi:hypothetical protein